VMCHRRSVCLLLVLVSLSSSFAAPPSTRAKRPPYWLDGNPAADVRPMPRDFKVAFIADTDLSAEGAGRAVLQLVKRESPNLILHQGDFDYLGLSDTDLKSSRKRHSLTFDAILTEIFRSDFPVFGAVGNNDVLDWYGPKGYQDVLYKRIVRSGNAPYCKGTVGESLICSVHGFVFVQSSTPIYGANLEFMRAS